MLTVDAAVAVYISILITETDAFQPYGALGRHKGIDDINIVILVDISRSRK